MHADSDDPSRLRLDDLLVRRGLFASRSRARDAVIRGTVRVCGRTETKPGAAVAGNAALDVDDPASAYVSRAALKLLAGLERFGFDPAGRLCLDLGASTGGFTQVLLERGARQVIAVDVGHGQLAPSLAADHRVVSLEGVNARALDAATLSGAVPDALVCDLSFISLRLALAPALSLAAGGAWGVFLVKPQFEVGRDGIGRGGLVRDANAGLAAAEAIAGWLDGREGWRVAGLEPSPLIGGDGNREYLLGARRKP